MDFMYSKNIQDVGLNYIWISNVGLNYIWISNNIENINWLCREVKSRLEMQFMQKWNSDVQASRKCINYRIFKTNFKIEPYITELQPLSFIILSRFRTKNNRLPVEWGRWENVDCSQRFCNLCTGNMLGNEFHYLLECKYFTEERKKYLPKFYLQHVNTLKFQKLMSAENLKLLKQLSRFISIVIIIIIIFLYFLQ